MKELTFLIVKQGKQREADKMYRPQITYNDPLADKSDSFVQYFANRVLNNNKNFLCAVTGPTGAGKSWLCGAIGEKYSKVTGIPFDSKVHILFSLKELLDLINSPNLSELLPPGSFILFDEPQVSVNSRSWQSESNQILSTLVSTFRNMRLVIFFATPYLEFLDKQSRILFHAEIEVQSFDKTTNYTTCKPRLLEWNGRKQEFYKKRLIIRYKIEGREFYSWYYLQLWEVHRPSNEWIKPYEELKARFTHNLNQELQQQYNFNQAQQNKGRDLVALSELYDKYGENYVLFARELPHLSPYNLKLLVGLLKRQEKAKKSIIIDDD